MEVNHTDGKDGTQLDDDQEHFPKCMGNVESEKVFNEYHVPGATDREPFSNPFNNPENQHL